MNPDSSQMTPGSDRPTAEQLRAELERITGKRVKERRLCLLASGGEMTAAELASRLQERFGVTRALLMGGGYADGTFAAAECVDELANLLAADTSLYGHGYGAAELRGIMARREWPSFIDRPALVAQLHRILDLSAKGLARRGFGEEPLLAPLRRRADALTNPALEQLDRLARGEAIEEIADDYGSLSPEEVHNA